MGQSYLKTEKGKVDENLIAVIPCALLGLPVGMVINRAADNLPPPHRRSLFAAPVCAYCGSARLAREQSGLFSFLTLRDRCHACRAPLPLRAPVVEIATVLCFSFLAWQFGIGAPLVVYSTFTAILILLAVIDLEHRLILNVIVLPAMLLAILASPITLGAAAHSSSLAEHLVQSLVGGALGLSIALVIYLLGILFVRITARRREELRSGIAFGLGDVKLAGMVGALVGAPAVIYVIFYAILLGGAGALLVIFTNLFGGRGYRPFAPIPYGPFIILPAWVFMVWGQDALRIVSGQ